MRGLLIESVVSASELSPVRDEPLAANAGRVLKSEVCSLKHFRSLAMRKLVAVIVVVALCGVALTGCTGPSGSPPPPSNTTN